MIRFQLLEQRASSAYFPGLHIPLLPHHLCLLSSLLPVSPDHPSSPPHQPNPCITITITVDHTGSITNTSIAPYFLPNLVRLTYDLVDRAVGCSQSAPSFREPWQTHSSDPLLHMPTDPRKGFVYDKQHVLAFQQLQQQPSSSHCSLALDLRRTLLSLSSAALLLRGSRRPADADAEVDFYSEFHSTAAPSSPSSPSPSPPLLDVCGRMSSSTALHPPPPHLQPSSPPSTMPAAAATSSRTTPAAAAAPLSPRLNARHTVAEFMVAACIASASWCRDRNIAVHYRSQAAPNLNLAALQQHSMRAFAATAAASLPSLCPAASSVFPSAHALSVYISKMTSISGMMAAVTDMQPQRHHGIGADAYVTRFPRCIFVTFCAATRNLPPPSAAFPTSCSSVK